MIYTILSLHSIFNTDEKLPRSVEMSKLVKVVVIFKVIVYRLESEYILSDK